MVEKVDVFEKMTKCLAPAAPPPPKATGPQGSENEKVAGNDKVAGILPHSPLPPVDSSSRGPAAARAEKTTKSLAPRPVPGGSVVIYILNGSVLNQAGFTSLLEKPQKRLKRWLVERK